MNGTCMEQLLCQWVIVIASLYTNRFPLSPAPMNGIAPFLPLMACITDRLSRNRFIGLHDNQLAHTSRYCSECRNYTNWAKREAHSCKAQTSAHSCVWGPCQKIDLI